mmetsp:Transcript_9640/g.16945  ORF Transcript_9640/g.16945 Transcript_9640/m.16945 type:complete len:101 (-) Transcript_9640:217-519(-)
MGMDMVTMIQMLVLALCAAQAQASGLRVAGLSGDVRRSLAETNTVIIIIALVIIIPGFFGMIYWSHITARKEREERELQKQKIIARLGPGAENLEINHIR